MSTKYEEQMTAISEEEISLKQVIAGLSADNNSVYLIDLEKNRMVPYHIANSVSVNMLADVESLRDYDRIMQAFASKYVVPEYRRSFLREVSEEVIRNRLAQKRSYQMVFCRYNDERETEYVEVKVSRIGLEFHGKAVMRYRTVTEEMIRIEQELAEKQAFRQKLEQTLSLSEQKSYFMYEMLRDIRIPTQGIGHYVEMARKSLADEEKMAEYLDGIMQCQDHLLQLLANITIVEEIKQGLGIKKREDASFSEQWQSVLEIITPRIEEKQLKLIPRLRIVNDRVHVDTLNIRRIMLNLLENAIKFTPEGGNIQMTVEQKTRADEGRALYQIVIKDSGVGMSEEFQQHLFDAFRQENKNEGLVFNGTGLGLSMTKMMIDQMGGDINIISEKGKGTEVIVRLMLSIIEEEGI